MDQNLVASIRKDLERKSTPELQQAYESGAHATWSPEAFEAMRQILEERLKPNNRVLFALSAAIILGTIGSAAAWWQEYPGLFVLLAGVGCAVLGAASFYVRGLFGQPS